MRSFLKRFISGFFACIMVLALLPTLKTEVRAASMSLAQLQSKYPHGSYWNHYVNNTSETGDNLMAKGNESFSESLTSAKCYNHPATKQPASYYVGKYDCNYFDGGMQCCGFARKMAYEAYGTRASKWSTSKSVKPGDVVWFKSSETDQTYGHWVFVYAVSGTKITVGECNIGSNRCQIRWGHTYNMSAFSTYKIYSAPYTLPVEDVSVDVGTNFYAYIINTSRWKHLTDDGNNISMRSETGEANQIWYFERQSNGTYSIRSANNKHAMEVQDCSSQSGANVQTNPYTGSEAQQWYISGVSAKYQFRAKCTKCVLDVSGGSSDEGTNIQMHESNNTDAQYFQIWPLKQYIMKPTVTTDSMVYKPGTAVKLSWDECLGTTTYWINIWKDSTSGTHLVSKSLGLVTSYEYLPPEPGCYYITVEACTNANGWVSAYSDGTHIIVADNPFTDVPTGAFYEAPVLWALENGITSGATPSTFNPNGKCLRAQVVTFLHRADGNPEPTVSNNPFTDVKTSDFFYKPVLWAVENSITSGVSATQFGSYHNCNRAAVVTFLWRAAGCPEPVSTANPFTDVKTTDYYYKSVLWAVENGITAGLDATHFGPTAECNRAQVVTFLYRAYN
jgi:hypothetical protein